jgi:APA family basic amino acid/polyamine antiporter
MVPDTPDTSKSTRPKRQLTLFDSTSIIVGIIIGVGIYKTAPDVANSVTNTWSVLGLWIAGGVIALCGALCYAELATAYPREGGDYVYLSRAYGPWAGFLFGWMQLAVVRPGDIAVMAFAFATYAQVLYDPFANVDLYGYPLTPVVYSGGAVLVMTLINIVGVQQGKWAQNTLTVAKVLGLCGIIGIALFAPHDATPAPASESFGSFPIAIALILVCFTFGGWNEMAYVAAEVKNPKRNIARALVLGTCAVTVLYVVLNAAFLYTLGHEGMAASSVVAYDAISTVFPDRGGNLISLLICISALGAVNGLVFTGARISYALGKDHKTFGLLGRWNPKTETPAIALAVQSGLSLLLIVILGSFMEALMYTAAAVYSFYLATCMAVVILRRKEPDTDRPFKIPAYPLPIILFAAACSYLIYSAVTFKPIIAAAALGVITVGLIIYAVTHNRNTDPTSPGPSS